jgi:hypothetical protein
VYASYIKIVGFRKSLEHNSSISQMSKLRVTRKDLPKATL